MSLAKSAGEHGYHRAAQLGKSRLQPRIGEASVDLLVQRVDDPGRRALRSNDAIPLARLNPGHDFVHRWQVRQRFGAHGARHRKRPQRAGIDVLDRSRNAAENHLHLAPDEIGQCGRQAAIRHESDIDAGLHLEQRAGHMIHAAGAAERHFELARVGLGIGDEFGNGLDRQRWIDHGDERHAHQSANRRNVPNEVETEIFIEGRVYGVRRSDKIERVAVRGRTGRNPSIKALPVELPGARRTMRIISLKNRSLSPLAELFIDTMLAIAKPLTKGK